jgi:glucuronate isomerase
LISELIIKSTLIMKPFMDENFLLESKTAERLYHEYARDLPIIDYHCHLAPAEIAADMKFANLTKIWLDGDHYKWRAMRANGVKLKNTAQVKRQTVKSS